MSTATVTLRALFAGLTSVRRAVTKSDIRTAIRCTSSAKSRVRVYSRDGFVPKAYRWAAAIQFVEGTNDGNGWQWRLGWTDAKRPYGSGQLIIIR